MTTFTSSIPNSPQAELVADVAATSTPTTAMSLGLPYDLADFSAPTHGWRPLR